MDTPLVIATRMVNELFPMAAAVIKEGQQHIEMMVVELKDGKREIYAMPGLGKNHIAHLHREKAADPKVRAAALILEAWGAKLNKDTDSTNKIVKELREGNLSVRDIPERVEMVIYNVRVGEHQFLSMCEIERPSNILKRGEVVDVNARPNGERMEGRFIGDGKDHQRREMH